MSANAGQLLFSRQQITIPVDAPVVIDTGLCQVNRAFGASSDGEPGLGITSSVPVPDGALPASRVMVLPLVNALGTNAEWDDILIGEPFFNSATGTVCVPFAHGPVGRTPYVANVLFWDPHTAIGPVEADTYSTLAPT